MGTIKIEFDIPNFERELKIDIVIKKDGEVVCNTTTPTPETKSKKSEVKAQVAKSVKPSVGNLMMAVADAGGEDYEDAEDQWIVTTDGNTMMSVKNALVDAGIEVKGAEVVMEPTNPVDVDPQQAKKVMRLIDNLEDLEDLQNVYHTMNMTDEVLAAIDEE